MTKSNSSSQSQLPPKRMTINHYTPLPATSSVEMDETSSCTCQMGGGGGGGRSETDATILEKVVVTKRDDAVVVVDESDGDCHNSSGGNIVASVDETEVGGCGGVGGRRRRRMMISITAESRSSLDSLMRWTLVAIILLNSGGVSAGGDGVSAVSSNSWERPGVMPKIAHLEVMCGNQHMEVHLAFDKPFHGLVTSKGMYGQGDCIYVPPRTGKNKFVFNIYYDKCGTKPDNHGKFYENTIVVQYDEELIEAWDEAKRLRCEWFNDYEKTATKTSPMVISDLDIVELNFHGDNVDCWMEIQEGKGPWAAPLNGIAPLGSPLTMVIAVKDPSGEFDMRVKDCEASDGASGKSLPLSDPDGCIMRPKLLGKFSKIKLDDGRATVLTYAFISAFKFPDMLNVHLRCTVEICRHGCPDHCTGEQGGGGNDKGKGGNLGQYTEQDPVASGSQASFAKASPTPTSDSSNESSGEKRNPPQSTQQQQQLQHHNLGQGPPPQALHQQSPPRFPPQLHSGEMFNANVPPQMRPPPPPLGPQQYGGRPQRAPRPHLHHFNSKFPSGLLRQRPDQHRFPPGPPVPRFTGAVKHNLGPEVGPGGNSPQTLEKTRQHATLVQNMLLKPEPKKDEGGHLSERSGEPSSSKEDESPSSNTPEEKVVGGGESKESEDGEREMLMEAQPLKDDAAIPPLEEVKPPSGGEESIGGGTINNFPKGPRNLRLRRSVSSPRDVIGVMGAFKVVSQADLNFALNTNSTFSSNNPTIILRGRMGSDVPIYGICLPRVGFGVVFFGLGLATLVAILIAAFLAYAHYALLHYKPQAEQPWSEVSQPPPHPQQEHYVFPMLILKKMW